jgi:hypothetical protein
VDDDGPWLAYQHVAGREQPGGPLTVLTGGGRKVLVEQDLREKVFAASEVVGTSERDSRATVWRRCRESGPD